MCIGSLKQIGCPPPSMGLPLGNLWLTSWWCSFPQYRPPSYAHSRGKKTVSLNYTLLAYLHLHTVHRLLPPIDHIKSKRWSIYNQSKISRMSADRRHDRPAGQQYVGRSMVKQAAVRWPIDGTTGAVASAQGERRRRGPDNRGHADC
jgi:hypothetical protein